jgi:hypothetical protein
MDLGYLSLNVIELGSLVINVDLYFRPDGLGETVHRKLFIMLIHNGLHPLLNITNQLLDFILNVGDTCCQVSPRLVKALIQAKGLLEKLGCLFYERSWLVKAQTLHEELWGGRGLSLLSL